MEEQGIENAFQAQQARIDQLTQNLQMLQSKPLTCQLRPNINVNTREVNKPKTAMFLVHASATLNTFTNQQLPIPSGFSNTSMYKVKFSDSEALKHAFTNPTGFKALRVSNQFTACVLLLGTRDDDVVNTICTWLLPLLNQQFDGIPLVIGLPEEINGAALFDLRNQNKNVAFVDNRANPDIFNRCQKLMAYAGAMVKNVQPMDGEVVMETAAGPSRTSRGRGRGGRGRGGRRGRGRRNAFPY